MLSDEEMSSLMTGTNVFQEVSATASAMVRMASTGSFGLSFD